MKDRALFLRNLKGWTPHVLLAATPSFLIACTSEFTRVPSVIGMVAGIFVFLLLYPTVWSSAWFRRRVSEGSAWDQALTYGRSIRSFLGGAGIVLFLVSLVIGKESQQHPPLYIFPLLILIMPDFFSGIFSGLFISWAVQSPLVRAAREAIGGTDAHARGQNLVVGDVNSLVPTFVITLVQGILLTLMLLGFALVCRGCMWLNAWRKSRREPSLIPASALT